MGLTKVTGTVIANNTINTAHMTDEAISNVKIAFGSITGDRLHSSVDVGALSADLANFKATSNANDYATYIEAMANDLVTFQQSEVVARANDYITWTHIDNVSANVNQLSQNTLPLSGGTMTGDLSLSGLPTANAHAASKEYVDSVGGANGNGVASVATYVVNSEISSGSNVFALGTGANPTNDTFILTWADGVYQSNTYWQFNSGNDTIQFLDATFPSTIEIVTNVLTTI